MPDQPTITNLKLKANEVEELKAAGDRLALAKSELAKLKEIGVDTSELESDINDIDAKRQKLISIFG